MNRNALCTDQELLERLKKGDELAYKEIYTRYWPLLFRHSIKVLHDEDQAMDVVQDIFTSFWLNHASLSQDTSLASYFYTATRNRALNMINREKSKERYLESLQSYINKGEYITDNEVNFNELSAEIESEISKLPPRMREIFELRQNAGLSYKQIAIQLGISNETVKTQVARALKSLRSKFGCGFMLPFI